MERLRRTLRWRNSSTQTRAEAVGLANQAGETFFQGVRDMTMQNPTFIQHIHGDPSTSQPDGLSTAVNQNSGNEASTSIVHPETQHLIETTIRAPYEIYYEELLKQKRGPPLWFPGPSLDLPRPYRRNGINVGDIGILQVDEPFDFLFNIFLPADDPINSKGVPESFQPLSECDVSEVPCDMQGGSVGSSSVRRSVHSEPSGLTFETSAAEGAILVLPQGSSRTAIKSLQSIWDYMTPSTVQSWYQYAKKRGRQIQNGNIVVVFKCDKASSWGIATFSSIEGQMTSLTFKEVNGNQPVTPTYDWVCNGTANTQMRVGPSADENSDFSGVVKNQCVFLQALNPRLSDRSWRELEQRLGAKVDESSHEILQYPAFVGGPSNHPLQASAPSIQGNFQKRLINHPSSALNICLLKNYPNARMAITTDENWIPLMTQEGALLPSQQLFDQIQQSYIIRNKDGVVFLDQLKSEPSRSPSTHPYDMMDVDSPVASEPLHDPGAYPPDDDMHYIGSTHPQEISMHAVETLMMSASNDLHSFIRPFLDEYVGTPDRLAFGERSVIVMSSKVAQKSYGTEKRFLCPPPTAIMIGNSWWSGIPRCDEEPKPCPPRIIVSISGEPVPQEGTIEWTASNGKAFDVNDVPPGTTFIGRCVGQKLFISGSDVNKKKKEVEALVKIMAPSADDETERVIGVFPSRPIKVISKPSKKRQSAKNLELCIIHGSTISLFHRLRSQTVSTKYLCVSGSRSSFKGSDGAPMMGLDQRVRAPTPSFIARTASWDSFIMYIVDVNKPLGGALGIPPPPPQQDYPSPPPNAIPFTNNGSQTPIYYNQTVVLQCLTSGVVSPVLIIRKVDHQTTAVGGDVQEGAKGIADHYCAPGEVCGDPVSQLHKVAFEVYDPAKSLPEPGTPGVTGAFLSCMGEKVNTYRPIDGRLWNTNQGTEPNSPTLPGSPVSVAADSKNRRRSSSAGSVSSCRGASSEGPASGIDSVPASNDGGRVMKKKRSTSRASGVAKPVAKYRRRSSSAGSVSSCRGASSEGPASGPLWQVDVGETSIWTIVGTDQVRYNFYVPPVLFDNQKAPQTGSFPIPSKSVTPFPGVVKYLPPDRAAPKTDFSQSPAMLAKSNLRASKMLTLYGENFSKADPVNVFFGSEPSPYVEVCSTDAIGCLPPESQIVKRRPIILIRSDGVVFPSDVLYP